MVSWSVVQSFECFSNIASFSLHIINFCDSDCNPLLLRTWPITPSSQNSVYYRSSFDAFVSLSISVIATTIPCFCVLGPLRPPVKALCTTALHFRCSPYLSLYQPPCPVNVPPTSSWPPSCVPVAFLIAWPFRLQVNPLMKVRFVHPINHLCIISLEEAN
jgi:hypothetical protein